MGSPEQAGPGAPDTLKYPPPAQIPTPYEIGYHHEKYLKYYKGCYVAYPKYLTLPDVETFQASPLDVAVCAFPKSGTTWLNGIVVGILGDGDPNVFHDAPLQMKSPFLCRCEPDQEIGARPIDILKQRPPGRTFFTHLPYQALPDSVITAGCKKVFVYRNPKDCAVSLLHLLEIETRLGFHGDLNEVVNSLINDTVDFGPYFDHLASFWARRHEDPNLFICSFEQLKKNALPIISDLAKFLGKDLTTDQVMTIHNETEFKNFQENPFLNKLQAHERGFMDFNKHLFIRDGSIGQWKNWFTSHMNEKMDAWIYANLNRPELQGLVLEFE